MIRHIWAVLGGRKPGNDQEVISSDNMIYLGILHNNGNSGATSPLLSNKLVNQQYCDKPIKYVNGLCDNRGIFITNSTGSFKENGDFKICYNCGGENNICMFEFRITQRYARDNYKVYFETADFPSQTYFARATPIYTAVKHLHIERDKMCRNGGILKQDALSGDSTIYLAMNPDGTRADNINLGNTIHIFDSATPYEKDHDIACVKYLEEDATNKRVRIDLGQVNDCSSTCNLNYSYYVDDDNQGNDPWDFSSGNSAGVCKNDNMFYVADTSGLQEPFSDGFVTFHITKDGFEGSNVVPYLPDQNFSTPSNLCNQIRFHQIWFYNKSQYDCAIEGENCLGCCNYERNIFHLMGVRNSDTGRWGKTRSDSDITYSFIKAIEDSCAGICDQDQLWAGIRHNVDHDIGHQFNLNCPNASPPPTDYHDLNDAWCGNCNGGYLLWCMLHSDNEPIENRIDGVDRLCCYNLLQDSSYCGDTTECGEGVRVGTDPK